MHLFIPIVALVVLIIVIAFLIKSRKRAEPPARPQPVETEIVGLDTTPHNRLRALVRPITPGTDDVTMNFLDETSERDARFIVESICGRASDRDHEFVLGNVIYHDLVSAGALGNLVSVGAIVHTRHLSIRFAAIVEWDGDVDTEPIVRSVTFDDFLA